MDKAANVRLAPSPKVALKGYYNRLLFWALSPNRFRPLLSSSLGCDKVPVC